MFTVDTKMGDLKEFCCICVKKYPHLENVNDTDEENIKHHYKLSLCAPDQNWLEDYYMCKNCIEGLNSAYNFLQACIKSEELREQQIKLLQEEAESKLFFKEAIPQTDFFICNTCNKEFKLKRSLKLHITRIHTERQLKLSRRHKDAKADLSKESNFKNDIKEEETDSIEYNENDNDRIESSYSSDEDTQRLEIKKRYNKSKIPLTCEYCEKVFHRRQHYSSHIRSKHTFEKPYKCDLCDARYTNSHSLLVHKRNHKNEKPFICSYCGKSFVCSGDLYHHSKIHLNKREYKCNLCDKSFNTTSILRTHKICIHTDPKDWKYVCAFCNKRFPINSSLVTHTKRHTGVKEFSCHICEKMFFDKSELTKHFRSHSSERLFKCNLCQDKEYKNRYGLRKHMKIIHNVGTINISKPVKKFLCPMCPKIFAFNNKLQKHMYSHTGEKPFKCDYCDKKFTDKYYQKVHLKKKHNIELTEEFT